MFQRTISFTMEDNSILVPMTNIVNKIVSLTARCENVHFAVAPEGDNMGSLSLSSSSEDTVVYLMGLCFDVLVYMVDNVEV